MKARRCSAFKTRQARQINKYVIFIRTLTESKWKGIFAVSQKEIRDVYGYTSIHLNARSAFLFFCLHLHQQNLLRSPLYCSSSAYTITINTPPQCCSSSSTLSTLPHIVFVHPCATSVYINPAKTNPFSSCSNFCFLYRQYQALFTRSAMSKIYLYPPCYSYYPLSSRKPSPYRSTTSSTSPHLHIFK